MRADGVCGHDPLLSSASRACYSAPLKIQDPTVLLGTLQNAHGWGSWWGGGWERRPAALGPPQCAAKQDGCGIEIRG